MTPPRSMSPASTTGTPGGAGEAHVGDVARAQVDLGRAARPLDEDEVGAGAEAARSSPARAAAASASARGSRAPQQVRQHPALHDDLRAGLALAA